MRTFQLIAGQVIEIDLGKTDESFAIKIEDIENCHVLVDSLFDPISAHLLLKLKIHCIAHSEIAARTARICKNANQKNSHFSLYYNNKLTTSSVKKLEILATGKVKSFQYSRMENGIFSSRRHELILKKKDIKYVNYLKFVDMTGITLGSFRGKRIRLPAQFSIRLPIRSETDLDVGIASMSERCIVAVMTKSHLCIVSLPVCSWQFALGIIRKFISETLTGDRPVHVVLGKNFKGSSADEIVSVMNDNSLQVNLYEGFKDLYIKATRNRSIKKSPPSEKDQIAIEQTVPNNVWLESFDDLSAPNVGLLDSQFNQQQPPLEKPMPLEGCYNVPDNVSFTMKFEKGKRYMFLFKNLEHRVLLFGYAPATRRFFAFSVSKDGKSIGKTLALFLGQTNFDYPFQICTGPVTPCTAALAIQKSLQRMASTFEMHIGMSKLCVDRISKNRVRIIDVMPLNTKAVDLADAKKPPELLNFDDAQLPSNFKHKPDAMDGSSASG